MRWVGLPVAAIVLLTAGETFAEKTKVAVLDFSTAGIGETAAKALSTNLTNIVAAEVARLGFDVISSTDINAMLSYERKKDLLGCEDDTTCLAELGGALGSDLMVAGSIGKLGVTYNLTLSLVDIKRAQVRQRFQGNAGSETVLASTVRRGVQVLFGKQQDVSGTGTLYVRTDPSRAKLTLDGRDVGTSPTVVDNVPAGDHVLVATKGELSARTTVFIKPDAIERINVPLRSAPPVRLKVFSKPLEAEVTLDGKVVGRTPLMLSEVPAGSHTVGIRLAGYRELSKRFQLSYEAYEAGGKVPFKITARLEPIPVLVKAPGLPAGTTVTVDGDKETFPLRVVPGRHDLVFSAPEHEPARLTITAQAGKPVQLNVPLQRFPLFSLEGAPNGAKILVDGKRKSTKSFRLAPGKHRLTISAYGHQTLEKSVEVASGVSRAFSAKLTVLPVYKDYLDEKGIKTRWAWTWGTISVLLGAGGAGMIGWTLQTRTSMQEAHKKYQAAKDVDDIAQHYDAAAQLRKDALWREATGYALFGSAALSAVLCVYAVATAPDDPLANKSLKVDVVRYDGGLSAALSWSF